LTIGRRLGNRPHNWVLQDSDIFDFDFDCVSRVHFSCASGGSGVDYVSGIERDVTADEAEHRWAVEDQVGRALVLDHLSVHARGELQVCVI